MRPWRPRTPARLLAANRAVQSGYSSVSHADRAAIDDHDAVYHAFGMLQVGLRQNHRHALELEPADYLRQPLRQCWRHTLERLVEQQQLVAAHQRAADRHHLLLASRNLRSAAR